MIAPIQAIKKSDSITHWWNYRFLVTIILTIAARPSWAQAVLLSLKGWDSLK